MNGMLSLVDTDYCERMMKVISATHNTANAHCINNVVYIWRQTLSQSTTCRVLCNKCLRFGQYIGLNMPIHPDSQCFFAVYQDWCIPDRCRVAQLGVLHLNNQSQHALMITMPCWSRPQEPSRRRTQTSKNCCNRFANKGLAFHPNYNL